MEKEIDKDLEDIFDDYLKDRNSELIRLKEAVTSKDQATIEMIGHKVGGNAGSYGLPDLGEIGAKLESCAQGNDFESISKLVNEMESYLKNLKVRFV